MLRHVLSILILCLFLPVSANATDTRKKDKAMLQLEDTMYYYFDNGPAEKFHAAAKAYKAYCLAHDWLHSYYKCWQNEVVFELNESNIFKAYKHATAMMRDLREKKREDDYYMATNMLGLVYADCNNIEGARSCFLEVLDELKDSPYQRGELAPIYMDLAYIDIEKHPEEALRWTEKAVEASADDNYLCDAMAFCGVQQFKMGKMHDFMESYKAYKQLEKGGNTSTFGKFIEIYHKLATGQPSEAMRQAKELTSVLDRYSYMRDVLEYQGDTIGAYRVMKLQMQATDSINSVILADNLKGISNEMEIAEAEKSVARNRIFFLGAVAVGALAIMALLAFLLLTRHRHIKQMKQKNDELQAALAHAEESDRMKTEFIKSVSHEIRTPLNIITGFAQIIAAGYDIGKAETNNMANAMMQNTSQITMLVNEMLELSQSESTSQLPKNDTVSVNHLCREAVAAISRPVVQGVEIKLKLPLADNICITTNHEAIQKILAALLDNAVKFTPTGTITLTALNDRFVVEDTGCGIAPSDAERIFERFVKVDEFREGLGLGLTVSRTLADRLGATVALDTSYAPGARFVLKL